MSYSSPSHCRFGRVADYSIGRILLLVAPVVVTSLVAGIGIYVAQRGGYDSMLAFSTCLPGSIICGAVMASVCVGALEVKSNAVRTLVFIMELAAIIATVVVLLPQER